jgi:Methyltransferase domain
MRAMAPHARRIVGARAPRLTRFGKRVGVTAEVAVKAGPSLALSSIRLQRTSRRAFAGWMTNHRSRWWEYPWVLDRARSCATGGKAADYGAGTSPVPIALRQLGLDVNVVDPDAETLLGRRVGNEWDLFDYQQWGISTVKAGVEDPVFDSGSLSLAVSVSVIEHIPAATRRQGFTRLADALDDGGALVVTIDLLPGTNYLWNLVESEVEPREEHGTIDDVLTEAASVGLRAVERARCPVDRGNPVEGVVFVRESRAASGEAVRPSS